MQPVVQRKGMKKISKTGAIGVIFASLLFLATYKFPFWVIYLTAPQYPEGLTLYIYLHKLAGDVEIINGLNHYIGMAIIDESDFPEFLYLPYIIGAITALGILAGIFRNRRFLLIYAIGIVLFSILAMVDFWRWEYVYGHNLDPNAAIQVPGMTYQPPLIGYKELLNFGAYSYPHGGGWFYISAVALICVITFLEIRRSRKHLHKHNQAS